MESSKAPFTLVRANVVGETVTEAADGTHYVLKDKDGGFHLQENNFLASEASDGLYVASYNQPNNSYVCCTHVNLANVTTNYTAHTYDYLYGTLNPSLKLFVVSDATIWLGGMTHHAGQNVNGIECQGSATINLVEGTTNDLTRGNEHAYNGICIDEETLIIDGTGTLVASGGNDFAGIGGLNANAHIVIADGTITATGGNNAAGIGANKRGDIGDITINGGTVVVNAGTSGWGIGIQQGASYYYCGDIKFFGGSVTVNGDIATNSQYEKSIYVNGVSQGSSIHASFDNPFVYPVPATQ